jgi:hypothetical protein
MPYRRELISPEALVAWIGGAVLLGTVLGCLVLGVMQ